MKERRSIIPLPVTNVREAWLLEKILDELKEQTAHLPEAVAAALLSRSPPRVS